MSAGVWFARAPRPGSSDTPATSAGIRPFTGSGAHLASAVQAAATRARTSPARGETAAGGPAGSILHQTQRNFRRGLVRRTRRPRSGRTSPELANPRRDAQPVQARHRNPGSHAYNASPLRKVAHQREGPGRAEQVHREAAAAKGEQAAGTSCAGTTATARTRPPPPPARASPALGGTAPQSRPGHWPKEATPTVTSRSGAVSQLQASAENNTISLEGAPRPARHWQNGVGRRHRRQRARGGPQGPDPQAHPGPAVRAPGAQAPRPRTARTPARTARRTPGSSRPTGSAGRAQGVPPSSGTRRRVAAEPVKMKERERHPLRRHHLAPVGRWDARYGAKANSSPATKAARRVARVRTGHRCMPRPDRRR